MKLLRYGEVGSERPGLLDAEARSATFQAMSSTLPAGARSGVAGALSKLDPEALPLVSGKPRIGACVAGTGKFICIGLNYSDHAAETGATVPPEPIIFMKATSAIVGPDDDIRSRAAPKDRLGSRARRRHRQDRANMSAKPTRWTMSPATASSHDVSERAFQTERRASGPRARAATRSARSAHGW